MSLSGILSLLRNALREIRKNALRSALTVLGILIGVASVLLVTSLGGGARDAVSHELDAVGSNLIIISPLFTQASGARKVGGARLTEDDARALEREAVSLLKVSPAHFVRTNVVFRDNSVTTQIAGAKLDYFTVHNWSLAEGALWDEHDESTKARVCVVGRTVQSQLFGTSDAVGQVIRIGRYPYRVVGTLAPKGSAFGTDQDDSIIVPLGGLRSRFTRSSPGQVAAITALATSSETVDRAVQQVDAILRQRHRIAEGAEPDFEVRSMKQVQTIQTAIFAILTLLLVSIAGVSLLVGGIGIMNIMLVSVTERTREIGIRMAIGARERDIRAQFLIEAVVLSTVGGLAGVILGTAGAEGIGLALDWTMHPSFVAIAASVLVSVGVGVSFGFLPARRAARLDPIVALRYE